MSLSDDQIEIYRQHRAAQEKRIYFLLAAAGAAIGLIVNQTKDLSLSYSQLPLVTAVVLWGLSFYFGCRHLAYAESTLYANASLLRVKAGEDPMTGRNQELIGIASEGIRSAIESNIKDAVGYARWQFRCLILGSIFYIGWHIFEMWLRSL